MRDNLIGLKSGRLVVKEFAYIKNKKSYWLCKCECGNEKIIRGDSLKNSTIKSCGCLAREKSAERIKILRKKENKYEVIGDYAYIKASNTDDIIRIDKNMLEIILKYTWYVDENKYAKTNYKNKKTIQMHKLITNTDENIIVDHIKDYNDIPRTLNNTKENLRIANKSQNSMNRKLASNNTSGYVGVSYSIDKNKWRAYIKLNGKYKHLGYYDDIEDAIDIRQKYEKEWFKEYRYI